MTQTQLKNNVPSVKVHWKHHERLINTPMQRNTAIDPKVIETTSTDVFTITNVTIDKENIWNTDNDVFKSKINDVCNTIVHLRKSLFLLSSGSTGKRFIEEMIRLIMTE